MPDKRPIIIIKKKGGHGGHHGGAWKVAYADFVTAMMALFIVLWLLSSSAKVKKAVEGYFKDPASSQKEAGSGSVGKESVAVDKESAQQLKEQIEKAVKDQKEFQKLAKQIEITITPEGLRIELIEDKKGTFFQSGSAKLSDTGQQLLGMLAGELRPLPNHLLLEGHTDAQPYSSDLGYTNWELSADRANSARRVLQQDGVGKAQISQVRGYADQLLRLKNDPMDPSNRRISLIVQWLTADQPAAPGDGKNGDVAKALAGNKNVEEKKIGPAVKAGAPEPDTGKAVGAKPEPGKAATAKAGEGTARPAAPTTTPAPNKAALVDRLKSMLPGNKPAPK